MSVKAGLGWVRLCFGCFVGLISVGLCWIGLGYVRSGHGVQDQALGHSHLPLFDILMTTFNFFTGNPLT